MNRPEIAVLDSNACITSALYLGTFDGSPVYDYFCLPVRNFINGCLKNSIRVGYFQITEDHAWGNLVQAINDLADKRGIRPARLMKSYERAKVSLSGLFSRLTKFDANCTDNEFSKAVSFFKSIEKDIAQFLNLQHPKQNLPEEHDLRIFVSCHNLDTCNVHLVSDDGHFVAYKREIENSPYRVRILPVKDLNQTLDSLGWPNPR